eukprot:COSAG01_NODE_768_length_13739_cov_6.271334_14_plen_106_part_00
MSRLFLSRNIEDGNGRAGGHRADRARGASGWSIRPRIAPPPTLPCLDGPNVPIHAAPSAASAAAAGPAGSLLRGCDPSVNRRQKHRGISVTASVVIMKHPSAIRV